MAAEEVEEVYSVWAIPPEGEVRDRLRRLMEGLRSDNGGPAFEPHVTVVGAIRLRRGDAVGRFRKACEGMRPYIAQVESVSRGGFFFQCVYLLLHPSPEVIEASVHCCSHFGYESSTPYMPHLSLLYGELTDEEKQKAIERVKVLDQSICELRFQVSTLALYRTDTEDKTLQSWEKVTEYNIS
ncbi:Cyclic phosphodiesterase [Acorus gramineus]|uniref:Cyclic phosphodiesterase n=1 Tax=Acorus gramineus TaxID=55184 RepID=A0AAV9BGA3_ACOGR|nr:Cyclic phosphodiesterase [Acorus gramineus]